ncbi:integrase [Cedecea neteri]|uniref:integrase n=1 Tax=Cedecea neteri TaxID=158822 RepID=UPI002AA6D784|nr:integrase [Cedecea neteri]WPU25249.1 integrase [Cedecea neteri]
MTLHELMEWSGHSCPYSTLYCIRIRLTAAFVKADKISHMIGVLIDHDSQAMSETGPALYYGPGELYCANPFWNSCPHRMACIGCDFSLPKSSARTVALESRASIRRHLEEVPLAQNEQVIATGTSNNWTLSSAKSAINRQPKECYG